MRLITLNCALSPWSPGRKKRLPYIVKALIDEKPDVIFFQEVFWKSDANYIVKKLIQSGFTDSFYSDTLLIISKYPFISHTYQRFKLHFDHNIFPNIYKLLNWIYGKGYQVVELNFDNQLITFINTHLLSTGYGHDYNLYHLARMGQFTEIYDYFNNELYQAKRIIVGGDFNFDINSSSYTMITNGYGFTDPLREVVGNTFSADNLNRKFFWLEKLNQRLDHIFIKGFEGHKTFGKIVFCEPYFVNGNKLQVSDHYGLALDIQ
ncbi:MAG TPA: endonuclease/exonuclease/phosphatase family protein [Candidatus Paceibacterota bacterium]